MTYDEEEARDSGLSRDNISECSELSRGGGSSSRISPAVSDSRRVSRFGLRLVGIRHGCE